MTFDELINNLLALKEQSTITGEEEVWVSDGIDRRFFKGLL